jgi:hypothetical protein
VNQSDSQMTLVLVRPRSETTLRSHQANVISVSQCQDHADRGYRGQPVSRRVGLGARGIVRRRWRCLTLLAAVTWPLNSIADSENDRVCSIDMLPWVVRPSPSLVTKRLSLVSPKKNGVCGVNK